MEYIDQSSWVRLYEEGQTLQQIAEVAGVSSMTVLRHLRTAGVETRTRGRRKTEGERRCTACRIIKPLESFERTAREATGYGFTCRVCSRVKARKQNLRKFGIDEAQYERLLAEQEGCCKICQAQPQEKRLAIDHCHSTGEVRGLLCDRCNLGLGYFADDPVLLQKAIQYLFSSKDVCYDEEGKLLSPGDPTGA